LKTVGDPLEAEVETAGGSLEAGAGAVGDRLQAEVETAVLEAFDRAYREFRFADPEQRLAQAEFAATKQQSQIIAQVLQRDRDATGAATKPDSATVPAGANPIQVLGRDVRRQLDERRRANPDEAEAVRRVQAEAEAVIARGLRDYESATYAPALGQLAADRTRAQLRQILRDLPRRLADEQHLAGALTEAARRFDELPGAERLAADAPLRARFLSEAAGKVAAGFAHLTSSAQQAAVAAKTRTAEPDGATLRTELLKPGHAPGGRIISMAGGVYLAAGTDLGPPAQELAAAGDVRVVAGPGALELRLADLPSVAAKAALTGVTVDLGLLTEPAGRLRPVAGLLRLFGADVDGVEPATGPDGSAPGGSVTVPGGSATRPDGSAPDGSATAPGAPAEGAATTGVAGLDRLPATLPPVELTPLATPRPAEPATAGEPELEPEPDARQQYRAGFYERVGSPAPAEPENGFAADAEGERAELEWSLGTLAGHGAQWLDKGFEFLDAGTPEAREQILIDAIREAPAGTLRALSGLIRGVDAHPERDMPVSYAARAFHLALNGRAQEGAGLVREHWRASYPARDRVREALVARPAASVEERVALSTIGAALLDC
jgi:hypothetical protein